MLNNIKNFIDSQIKKNDETTINYNLIYKKIIDKFYTDKDDSIYKINFVFMINLKFKPKNLLILKHYVMREWDKLNLGQML